MPPAVDQGHSAVELIRLFVVLLGASLLVTLLARRIKLPYSVALVLLGIALGPIARPLQVSIDPDIVLIVLLPGLVFEAAYQIDFTRLRASLPGIAVLAGPGVVISAALIAVFLNVAAGIRFDEAFVVGAMLSATDPAAVIATFKQLRSPRRLSTIVEAESLLNDGTGIVLFTMAVAFVQAPRSPLAIGTEFVWVVGTSVLLGLVTGWLAARLMAGVGDHLIEVGLSVVLAYGTYLLADAYRGSPIIATVTAGIVLGNYAHRAGVSEKTLEALDTVWEFVAFLLTGVVFLLVGVAITLGALAGALQAIAVAAAAVLVGRAIIVYGLLGPMQALRRRTPHRVQQLTGGLVDADVAPIPSGWLHVIFWAGLRGAVSTALALSLPTDFPDRELLQGITLGVVLFTLLVEATTAELVVRRWGTEMAGDGVAPAPGTSPSSDRVAVDPASSRSIE